ncbi:sigma-70 family RNA polymerase sigma factor [Rhodanobacter sp. KK11]|jgi:RNA polymerase sigma factor for flagellar operon FliA|uniref:sigma-70 family RNA polymerase sigma factor n=1 Tax=Rhodanobacter sp. KK11 TaxID=3083255 RepID=UPI002966C002|nr:sigma-70 family RNA polymerase sigma factor [Rhodanobacter sp. KK11]MDW2981760.1 sigma-70 family RNA polymerase sigma factor [Rhodanobacter sp. KK11]
MSPTLNIPEKELWSRWVDQREQRAREALIQMHVSWSRLVARDVYLKARIRGAEWADYVQNATVGLIEAIDHYELGRGVDFRTYARHRVRGSVFNGLRHLASASHVRHPQEALAERSSSLAGGESDPLEAFTSWTVGMGIGYLLEVASLEDGRDDVDRGPYATAVREQLSEILKCTLGKLSGREHMVLTLHYFQHVPFVDIASQMQLTKGRISQIHRQAIESMRAHMKTSYSVDAR